MAMRQLQCTPVADIAPLVDKLRHTYNSGRTRPLEYRKEQLKRLTYLVLDNQDALVASVEHNGAIDVKMNEVGVFIREVVDAVRYVDSWAKTEKKWAGPKFAMHRLEVRKEPKGVVVIVGTWNFPLALLLCPLVGAIAAGCTVVIKPSELAPGPAQLLADLLPKYLDPDAYAVVNGGVEETTELLDQKLDHYFYTGSTAVGKVIAQKAAKHLATTTLELGGKCPAIIDDTIDLRLAARRILWAKLLVSGQACLTVDYAIVLESVHDRFIQEIRNVLEQDFFPAKRGGVEGYEDYARIVNERHYDRLRSLLDRTKGKVVLGGQSDRARRFIAPTVVTGVEIDDCLMQDELFGPILPVLAVKSMVEAVDVVRSQPEPLAIYVFTKNVDTREFIFGKTRSGAALCNDPMIHYVLPELPFGGQGNSGQGNYHGKYSFDAFTHLRSVVVSPTYGFVENLLKMRYPPLTSRKFEAYEKGAGTKVPYGNPLKEGRTSKTLSLSKYALPVLLVAFLAASYRRLSSSA